MKEKGFHRLALAGLLGLFGLIFAWTLWIDPPQQFPRAILLILLLGPLLLPLRGLLHARLQTHIWTSLLSLPYVLIGSTLAAAGEQRLYGVLMILLSLALFAGCVGFAQAMKKR
ncbi:DUF2069 domain-containing protein [Ectothiorhodospira lacustris]|uniref:DUF2069 domain-containing protein n=1 Tax=Ectothiorhodospira lacustris TaxID=2899127 RepID=UPI001EE78931|nr:DUF2069 domain-containing protein [Ectothiorhodospira lacustris]MCG5500627.1 DUF2069 domain-containing protein [Ectothiorhodospira lacustris]MCG5508936.1 DUF2069 domain-containing protein [Ectothiorhodospira lacustris]MCG5520727.1 DUF2069 domain-containing protein [Ectothiorhodospira lacustris]